MRKENSPMSKLMNKTIPCLAAVLAVSIISLTPVHAKTNASVLSPSPVTSVNATGSHIVLSQEQINNLRHKVCMAMSFGKNDHSVSIPDRIKTVIINNTGINPNLSSGELYLQMAEVWNKYSDQMICPPLNGAYPTQHVYKRAIALKVQEGALFDFFLSDHVNFPIDVNAVETFTLVTNNTVIEETLLDYIDKILEDPEADSRFNIAHIYRVKKIVERRFNGKRARELKS